MRPTWGDDYGIACCVSAMRIGKQMQFFGARVNLAKTLLYAINGGRDEISGKQVGPRPSRRSTATCSTTTRCWRSFDPMMDWLAKTYVNALNVIHYMHDKYCYERDRDGAARPRHPAHHGLRHRRSVGRRRQPVRDQVREGQAGARRARPGRRLSTTRASSRASATTTTASTTSPSWLVETFMEKIRKQPTYRDAVHTQSVLTITSNVVYGKKTGNTPGRPPARRALRARCQPDERARHERRRSRRAFGRQAALRRRRRTAFR